MSGQKVIDYRKRRKLNLIKTLPFTTIGEQYGVSDNSVRKWCKKYNLPSTKKEINTYTEDQWKEI